MCSFAAYDSESVGFDSSSPSEKKETPDVTTQTQLFTSTSTGSQTNIMATNEAQTSTFSTEQSVEVQTQYPSGLADFLRKVVPCMMEALDDNDQEFNNTTADTISIEAENLQKIEYPHEQQSNIAAGDQKQKAVLCVSWSHGGNSLAVSYGEIYHEDWCEHGGVIKVYSIVKSEDDQMKNVFDIEENNCVTALQYHTYIPALLAYGTAAGEVNIKNLRSIGSDTQNSEPNLTSNACHSSKRVSCVMWADEQLTSKLLWLSSTGITKKRGSSDLVLISSGTDGSVVVWQVNPNLEILDQIVSYLINGSDTMIPDISCFDFNHNESFIVGSKTGEIYSCKTNAAASVKDSDMLDPVVQKFETVGFPIVKLAFKSINQSVFVALSSNSEIGLYKLNQMSALKVFCLEGVTTCMEWVPKSPNMLILGTANDFTDCRLFRLFDLVSETYQTLDGGNGEKDDLKVTALCVNRALNDRIAVGLASGNIILWKLPLSQFAVSKMDGFEIYSN